MRGRRRNCHAVFTGTFKQQKKRGKNDGGCTRSSVETAPCYSDRNIDIKKEQLHLDHFDSSIRVQIQQTYITPLSLKQKTDKQ